MRLAGWLACVLLALGACRRGPPPEPLAAGGSTSDAASANAATPAPTGPPTRPSDAAAPSTASADAAGAAPACADSNDCPAGALCCERVRTSPRPMPPGVVDPFGRSVDREIERICTSTPETECDSSEICKGASCRRPQPNARLRCAGLLCTAPTPRCVLDITDVPEGRPPGAKRRAPKCADDEADAEGDASVFSCLGAQDCPEGTRCMLLHYMFSPTRFYARCVFKAQPEHGVEVAPMCRETAECAKLVEGLTAGGDGKPPRCRPVRGTPSYVRACEVPGTSMF